MNKNTVTPAPTMTLPSKAANLSENLMNLYLYTNLFNLQFRLLIVQTAIIISLP